MCRSKFEKFSISGDFFKLKSKLPEIEDTDLTLASRLLEKRREMEKVERQLKAERDVKRSIFKLY